MEVTLSSTLRLDVQRHHEDIGRFPEYCGFTTTLILPVGLHLLRVQTRESSKPWKTVRWRLLIRLPSPPQWVQAWLFQKKYAAWKESEQLRIRAQHSEVSRHIGLMGTRPTFAAIVDVRKGLKGLEETTTSIRNQIYSDINIYLLALPGQSLPSSILPYSAAVESTLDASVTEDFIVFIKPGEILATHAIYEFAASSSQYPDADLIYADQDFRAPLSGACRPFHKPDWSPDYLEAFDYIGFPACIRTYAIRGCLHVAERYELHLRVTEASSQIHHIREILGTSPERYAPDRIASRPVHASNLAALRGRLHRTGRMGEVDSVRSRNCYRIRPYLANTPLISIVIVRKPRDHWKPSLDFDLLLHVVRRVRTFSNYKNVELITVGSRNLVEPFEDELAEFGCQRVICPDPDRDTSRLRNVGAEAATGEKLLFLDDDVHILNSDWIESFLGHFEKRHVGAVGAKVLDSHGRIVHAGMVHNAGTPYSISPLSRKASSGYFFSTSAPHNFCSVSAACMMVSTDLFRQVGGFAREFPDGYNDVDLCQRIRRESRYIVYAPEVEVSQMRRTSRATVVDRDAQRAYQSQWAAEAAFDPYYNEERLSVEPPTFIPAVNPRLI